MAVLCIHDVGLVDGRDLLASVHDGKVKGKLGDALRAGLGDDLHALDDAGVDLVLETRVLALGVLADDDNVDVLVARGVAGQRLAQGHVGKEIELLADLEDQERVRVTGHQIGDTWRLND